MFFQIFSKKPDRQVTTRKKSFFSLGASANKKPAVQSGTRRTTILSLSPSVDKKSKSKNSGATNRKSSIFSLGPNIMEAMSKTKTSDAAEALEKLSVSKPFPFMRLPPELRETVYGLCMETFPIVNTAAIVKTPDMVRVPTIAQLDKTTRAEALSVFYRNREICFSLHCERNILRAKEWLDALGSSWVGSHTILIEGTGTKLYGDNFSIKILCSNKYQCASGEPQFRIKMRPGPTFVTDILIREMVEVVRVYLTSCAQCKSGTSEEGELRAYEMRNIVKLLERQAGWGCWASRPSPRTGKGRW